MTEPNFLTIDDAGKQLATGSLTASDLAEACLRQIERLNPTLNAFITVCHPEQSVSSPKGGARSKVPLAGIPLALKDLYETAGIRTTAGSKFFADYIPREDAFVVQRLKRAGVIILGKTNTHEIALGVTGVNPHYGAARNPWNISRITGGSSSGSAAAVAAGMCLGALGTDTGGSIRIPASLCGVVGLKPTYGRVSLRGVFPLSWNLDHAGPLTRSVKDAALLLQIMSGYDAQDPASKKMLIDDYLGHLEDGIEKCRVALAVGKYIEDSDPEVLDAVRQAARVFESLGAIVEEVDVSFLSEAALANGLMTQADGAAFHRERLVEHPDWFGTDVRQRLENGVKTSSTEYALARRTQAEVRRRCELLLQSHDFMLLPTTPIPATLIEGSNAIEQARRLTYFTAPFNLTGLPALSLPCGFTKGGLPVGLQITARPWAEAKALRAGHAYEQAMEWHKRRPVV